MKNEAIKDSGSTQEYSTGAHRDNSEKKGDCSLLPLKEVGMIMNDPVLTAIDAFMETRDTQHLADALRKSVDTLYLFNYVTIYKQMEKNGVELMGMSDGEPEHMRKAKLNACLAHMMLEASHIYQAGAEKYGRNNWKLGMPVDRYIDSGVRHYLKTVRGDIDEPHYRGFVWNLLCAMWTAHNHPELNQKSEPVRSTVQTEAK